MKARVRADIHTNLCLEVLNRVHTAQRCGLLAWQELAASAAFPASVRLGTGTWDVALLRTPALPSQAGGQRPECRFCAGGAEAGWPVRFPAPKDTQLVGSPGPGTAPGPRLGKQGPRSPRGSCLPASCPQHLHSAQVVGTAPSTQPLRGHPVPVGGAWAKHRSPVWPGTGMALLFPHGSTTEPWLSGMPGKRMARSPRRPSLRGLRSPSPRPLLGRPSPLRPVRGEHTELLSEFSLSFFKHLVFICKCFCCVPISGTDS